jgi:hypothetical protein
VRPICDQLLVVTGHALGQFPEQAQQVVLAGNIGQFSLGFQQRGNGPSLQKRADAGR